MSNLLALHPATSAVCSSHQSPLNERRTVSIRREKALLSARPHTHTCVEWGEKWTDCFTLSQPQRLTQSPPWHVRGERSNLFLSCWFSLKELIYNPASCNSSWRSDEQLERQPGETCECQNLEVIWISNGLFLWWHHSLPTFLSLHSLYLSSTGTITATTPLLFFDKVWLMHSDKEMQSIYNRK